MPEPLPPRRCLGWLLFALLAAAAARPGAAEAALSAEGLQRLESDKYVYVSSQRKDGSFSPPAEIWFLLHDGAVYVGTKKTTWRARRVAAGRTAAQVRTGGPNGPAFEATAEIVADPAVWKLLFETFAKKYPDGWPRYEKGFREGAADGSTVLIRYTPK